MFPNKKGRVSEWFKEAVLKTVDAARYPGVRIPPRPFHKKMDIHQCCEKNISKIS